MVAGGGLDFSMPESIRDLDVTSPGVEQEILQLPFQAFKSVLKRDDLRCRDEDHILDLLLSYLLKEKDRFCNDLR